MHFKMVGKGVDWTDLAGCCEHGDETSRSIKCRKFID